MTEEQSAAMTHEPKRQKQNNMAAMICQPAAVTADDAATITQPIITHQQQHKTCTECKQSLPNHLFPKQKFVKQKDNSETSKILICRQCRKNQTAKRCKQQPKPNTKQGRKSDSGIIRRPNNFGYCDYVDKLFSLNCFPDIVSLKVFTSAKDVSESMAAIQAAGQYGLKSSQIKQKSDNNSKNNGQSSHKNINSSNIRVKCLCIGDGSTPRTAVLACFLRKWDCVSIDPALQDEWHGIQPKGVRGLVGFQGTLEEYMSTQEEEEQTLVYDHLLLLCVHSHARLINNASVEKIMERFDNIPATLVSLPCCPTYRSQKDVGRAPDHMYEDDCVFSLCRKVEIWNLIPFQQ